jgi:hypothetical protein
MVGLLMRIYEPQNIAQWVMQYLGQDNILSPFAGNIRDATSQSTTIDPLAGIAAASGSVNQSPIDTSVITDLIDSLGHASGGGGSNSGSGSGSTSTSTSNTGQIQWYDAWGRPISGPSGVGRPIKTSFVSSL